MTIASINPTTGETMKVYPEMPLEQTHAAIQASHQAFQTWRRTDIPARAAAMRRTASLLRHNKESYARLMAEEMGKPVTGGRAEIEKCAWVCDYYAEHAGELLKPDMRPTDAAKSYVAFMPLGPILAVMPWNFPFWQVFRFAAAALMAGNSVILKHASNVPGCALAIEDLFLQCGFPSDLVRTLLVPGRRVDDMLAHPLIRAVTFTGSTEAGMAVAARAGSLGKKSVLELGGSDPYIVLEDADLGSAASICCASRLTNSGQSCIAAKRFIVVDSVRKPFEDLLVEKMKAVKTGNPLEEDTVVGPLARWDFRDTLHQQVQQSLGAGAACLLGGEVPSGKGAFYPPTVLTGVRKGMPAYDEELFGPVAAVISVREELEAIEVANDSIYGLGATVFTADRARGERIAALELEAGSCFVNESVRSDPRLPFGGTKGSGFGRELAEYGIREFSNIKTVYIK